MPVKIIKTLQMRIERLRRASLSIECAMIMPLFWAFVMMMISIISCGMRVASTTARLSYENTGNAFSASCAGSKGMIVLRENCAADIPLFRGREINAVSRIRPFNGEDTGDGSGRTDTVYVTKYGEVFHLYPECPHINVTVCATELEFIESLRNSSGGRYRPCRGFPEGYKGTVYYTPTGSFYYADPESAGLVRRVSAVPRSEHGDLPLCKWCAGKQAGK